jgi:catechol 2,3-dioxygenase-like lactoylglutathione lyase family enzyme
MVPARISLATLGVADVARSCTFYRSLGWETAIDTDDFAVFRTAGSFLALYPITELTRDIGDEVPSGVPRRNALAINVASDEEVDAAIAEALAAGGALLAAPERAEWGGYSGYFADPDGHAWEVARNPGWPLGDDGLPRIP